jgi:hypothetical protein
MLTPIHKSPGFFNEISLLIQALAVALEAGEDGKEIVFHGTRVGLE